MCISILEPLASSETRVTFVYAWERAPVGERLAAPFVRSALTSANRLALTRLAEQLAESLSPASAIRSAA